MQTESLITNYRNEINDIKKVIEQLEQPINDRYLQSLLLSNLDTEDIEDRKKIKEMMFMHIEKVTAKKVMLGNHKGVEITIIAKSGLSLYSSMIYGLVLLEKENVIPSMKISHYMKLMDS